MLEGRLGVYKRQVTRIRSERQRQRRRERGRGEKRKSNRVLGERVGHDEGKE